MENDTHDQVILVAQDGKHLGLHPRSTVHGHNTPLHLAFSLHLLTPDGELLVTRRSLGKKAWPGVWTNSCCGHLLPGEDAMTAAVRRAKQELGVEVIDIREAIPDFRYRAVDPQGIVENEICPVFVGRISHAPQADPAEVVELSWAPIPQILDSVRKNQFLWSPWFVLQAQDERLELALTELVDELAGSSS